MPIFYHNRPRTARISCGTGAGRSLLFVDVQRRPFLNQINGVIQAPVPGEIGADRLPDAEKDIPPKPEDGVLVYAALNPMTEDLEKSITRFNTSHEDVQIEVRDYSDESGVDRLVTELSLGQVPDIMELHRLGDGQDTAFAYDSFSAA